MTKLRYQDLEFKPYGGNKLPPYFKYDPDDKDLVDFYDNDANICQIKLISKVVDIYYEKKLVAYYAFSSSEIRAGKLQEDDRIVKFAHPAIMLGRLLVCKSMRGRNIGTCILQDIAKIALNMREQIPLRFLRVDALPQAVSFYKKNGFIDTGIKRGAEEDLSILYIDIDKIFL